MWHLHDLIPLDRHKHDWWSQRCDPWTEGTFNRHSSWRWVPTWAKITKDVRLSVFHLYRSLSVSCSWSLSCSYLFTVTFILAAFLERLDHYDPWREMPRCQTHALIPLWRRSPTHLWAIGSAYVAMGDVQQLRKIGKIWWEDHPTQSQLDKYKWTTPWQRFTWAATLNWQKWVVKRVSDTKKRQLPIPLLHQTNKEVVQRSDHQYVFLRNACWITEACPIQRTWTRQDPWTHEDWRPRCATMEKAWKMALQISSGQSTVISNTRLSVTEWCGCLCVPLLFLVRGETFLFRSSFIMTSVLELTVLTILRPYLRNHDGVSMVSRRGGGSLRNFVAETSGMVQRRVHTMLKESQHAEVSQF